MRHGYDARHCWPLLHRTFKPPERRACGLFLRRRRTPRRRRRKVLFHARGSVGRRAGARVRASGAVGRRRAARAARGRRAGARVRASGDHVCGERDGGVCEWRRHWRPFRLAHRYCGRPHEWVLLCIGVDKQNPQSHARGRCDHANRNPQTLGPGRRRKRKCDRRRNFELCDPQSDTWGRVDHTCGERGGGVCRWHWHERCIQPPHRRGRRRKWHCVRRGPR